MPLLENAVSHLAEALDRLETSLDARLDGQMADRDAIAAAQRCARTARAHTLEAGAGLGAAISDLKALLYPPEAPEVPEAPEARTPPQPGPDRPGAREDGTEDEP